MKREAVSTVTSATIATSCHRNASSPGKLPRNSSSHKASEDRIKKENLEKALKQVKTLERILVRHSQAENKVDKKRDTSNATATTSTYKSDEFEEIDSKHKIETDLSEQGCSRKNRGQSGKIVEKQRHDPYERGKQKRSDRKINGAYSVGSESPCRNRQEREGCRTRSRSPVIVIADTDETDEGVGAVCGNRSELLVLSDKENSAEGYSQSTSAWISTTSKLNMTENNTRKVQVCKPETQLLGEKFASWFYESLNSHNPTSQTTALDFGPQHFWDDAYLVILSETPEPNQAKFSTPFVVSQRFLAFTRDEQVLFNPNISGEGVFVRSDPHGLVMVLVCGTVHRNNECLGTFQQTFGIVKDPRFENNWKIKTSSMKVRTAKVTVTPRLEENPENQMKALMPP